MSIVGRVPATRGALIRLRDNLEFIKKGMEILKMKRDQLASRLSELIVELELRRRVESRLMEVYEQVKLAYSKLGYSSVMVEASSVDPTLEFEVKATSVMGVKMPHVRVKSKPSTASIRDIRLQEVARSLSSILEELLRLAEIEASIEALAEELAATNRRVNTLEHIVIPSYEQTIAYIENRLFEESLEEFVRTKFIRNAIARRRTGR